MKQTFFFTFKMQERVLNAVGLKFCILKIFLTLFSVCFGVIIGGDICMSQKSRIDV